PTQEWSSLQDVFYRKTDIYNLTSWAVNSLQGQRVSLGKNGGFIAIVRDQNALVPIGASAVTGTTMKIGIYTAAGQMVESLPWDAANRIVAMGFTWDEQLAVVLDEGLVRLYRLLTPCPIKLSSTATKDAGSSSAAAGNPSEPIGATSNSYYVSYSLGQEATETGIFDAQVWEDGIVFLTGAGTYCEWQFPITQSFAGRTSPCAPPTVNGDGTGARSNLSSRGAIQHEVRSYSRLPLQPISSPISSALPFSWALLPPSSASPFSESDLYVSPTGSSTLYKLSPSQLAAQDMRLDRGPFYAIRPSPDNNLLALLTSDWKLWVVSSDFGRSLSEFDVSACDGFVTGQTSAASPLGRVNTETEGKTAMMIAGISQIEWCGSNTVVIAFKDQVVMVGPFGDSIRYYYRDLVHLKSEMDGLRILSPDRVEFLCKVHQSTSAVFLPGSTHPASLLYDSSENLHSSSTSAKADEGIRAIRSQLDEAVEICIQAASCEWDVNLQKRLMRAADLGKTFLDSHDPSTLVSMAQKLRVLNAARHYEVAIPISHEEYEATGPQALLSRLTYRNKHLLALRISEFLRLPPDPILKHWARAKIARSNKERAIAASTSLGHAADDEVCDAIVEKFRDQPAVSYAEITKDAWAAGRVRLATKLLVHEPRAVDQVPLLLSMHEDKLALVKAVESGDTDLVYHALFRLKSQLSRADFFRIVQAPLQDSLGTAQASRAQATSYLALASNLLEVYARNEDRELLRDFYFQDDRRTESALLAIEEGYEYPIEGIMLDASQRAANLSSRISSLREAMKFFNEDKERVLEGKLTDEQIRLLGFQAALEKENPGSDGIFIGLNLNETIRICLKRNLHKKADKIRSDWKVPEKRFWNIKLRTLVEMRDWDGMWHFGNSKRSPIGYTPFIQRLIEAGEVADIDRYLEKMS
ncbi:hypothetical protein K437DRAFT_214166, partial [Tilletiaria anomala UBC 951]